MDDENEQGQGTINQPQTPLTAAIDSHKKNHSELSDLLGHLEKRLQPVLRPKVPSDTAPPNDEQKDASIGSDVVSPVTAEFQSSNSRLRRMTKRIGDLLDRLEV